MTITIGREQRGADDSPEEDMRSPVTDLTRHRVVQGAAMLSAVISLGCADPAVGPQLTAVGSPLLALGQPGPIAPSPWAAWVLPMPTNATNGIAHDVNDSRVVVGEIWVQGLPRAVQWVNNAMSFLGQPAGPNPSTRVSGINNAGVVVGNYNPGIGANKAVRWDAGVPTVLPSLPGTFADYALDINDAGVIVGESQYHAVRWIANVVQDLHPPGYAVSRATAINAAGDIAGWVRYPTGTFRAYLWPTVGASQELGVLSGDVHSVAADLNSAVTVVGRSYTNTTSRAFRWASPLGMTNANLGAWKTHATAISEYDRTVGHRDSLTFMTAVTRRGTLLYALPKPTANVRAHVQTYAYGVNSCGDVVGHVWTPTVSHFYHAVLWRKLNCDQ